MNKAVFWKGGGYLVSIASVLLLGVVSWDGAKNHPALVAALIAGMATSVVGMGMRLRAFLNGQKEKDENTRRIERLEAAVAGKPEQRSAA